MDSAVTLDLPISVLIIRTELSLSVLQGLLFSKSELAMQFSIRRAVGKKIKSENMHFGWIEIFLKFFYDFRIVTNYLDLGRSNEAVGVNSTQLSTFICVRAQVTNHCRERGRALIARARRRGVRDGEHLIAARNADEGDGGGDQALDEVRPIAPFLLLRRYLIL